MSQALRCDIYELLALEFPYIKLSDLIQVRYHQHDPYVTIGLNIYSAVVSLRMPRMNSMMVELPGKITLDLEPRSMIHSGFMLLACREKVVRFSLSEAQV